MRNEYKTTKLKDINIELITYNKNITYNQFRKIVLNGYFECKYQNKNTVFYSISNKTSYKNTSNTNNNNIFLSKQDFTQLLINLYFSFIKNFCKNTRKNNKTVKNFNFKKFKITCPILLFLIILGLFLPKISYFVKTIIILYYSICIIVKSYYLILGAINRDDFKNLNNDVETDINKLPKYTILIPMFKENQKTIQQAINSIESIEYPKNLLDIKLVLEEDDIQTKQILNTFKMPDFITPIWVPYFEPRTKPKACNVASLFAEGENVVIFDAEDIPDKMQLLEAINIFQHQKCDILQGCLTFYNFRKNILTECFNIEYTVWFKVILKIFAEKKITIPLGGTSNHIKYSFLEKYGFWDSYNVTEDLELSVIANKNNVEIQHLNSDTKEWCVVDIKSFIKQRTRWIKGYLLTYLLHCFDKKNFANLKNIIFYQVVVGYTEFCFLLLPFLFFSVYTINNSFIVYFWFFINLIYYSTYCFMYYSMRKNIDILFTKKRLFVFIIYPFYFILHIISAWLALFEIFYKPFYWSKTQHLND